MLHLYSLINKDNATIHCCTTIHQNAGTEEFDALLLQGDRGYEGPKGSRGPPGIGYKGDKVRWLTVRRGWDCTHTVKADLSDLSPV